MYVYPVIFVVIVLIYKILLDYHRPSKFPPGPRGLPIFGNIFHLRRLVKETKFYSHAWCQLADKYGPVVGLKLGMDKPLIIVSGRDNIVEMLNRPEFDGRPDGFLFRERGGGIRRGIALTDGKVWHDNRRFTLQTLKMFGFGKMAVETIILPNAVALTKVILELSKKGPIENMRNVISLAVVNTLWTLVAGTRYDMETKHQRVEAVLDTLSSALRDSNVSGGVLHYFPALRYFIPGPTGFTKYKQRQQCLNNFFMDIILEHKNNQTEDEFRDFVDAYLAKMLEEEKANTSLSSFDEKQLINVLKDLFSAGAHTTSSTVGFAIGFLATNQDVQRKVHNEIDSILKGLLPSINDKNRMPYMIATLAEVSRMANIGPTTIPHRAMKDTTLLNFEIKKNYTLLANLKGVHMDKQHWGDPEVFRPDRFISDTGQYIEDSWLLPFGAGRRKCPGENLAKNNIFIVMTCLLQKIQFILPPDHPKLNLEGVDGFTITPPDMTIIAIPRK